MSLPKWIPADVRTMITTTRKFDPAVDDIDDMILQDFQYENLLAENFGNDKLKAVKINRVEIKRVRTYLKEAEKNSKAHKRLEEWLDTLLTEGFNLMRDDVINWAKDSAGLINKRKMESFPGSPQWFTQRAKVKQKEKDKNQTSKH